MINFHFKPSVTKEDIANTYNALGNGTGVQLSFRLIIWTGLLPITFNRPLTPTARTRWNQWNPATSRSASQLRPSQESTLTDDLKSGTWSHCLSIVKPRTSIISSSSFSIILEVCQNFVCYSMKGACKLTKELIARFKDTKTLVLYRLIHRRDWI